MSPAASQRSKLVQTLVVLGLVIGSVAPAIMYYQSLMSPTEAQYLGNPVEDSYFSDYVSDSPDSVFYPNAYSIVSTRPFIIEEDYSEFQTGFNVDYDTALDIANQWLSDAGPPMLTWQLQVASNSTEPPSWEFRYTHPDFRAYVIVDALSGSVIEYESKYLHDFYPDVLTLEEAEDITTDFLDTYEYEIPAGARYIEGEAYDCHRFYSLIFQEYAGPVKVESSAFIIRTSAFTRGVNYFRYQWLGLSAVDFSGVLSPTRIADNSLIQMDTLDDTPHTSTLSMLDWTNQELALTSVASSEGEAYRLAWILEFNATLNEEEYEATLFVDGYSGNIFALRDISAPYRLVPERTSVLSTEFLLGASGFSLLVLVFVISYMLVKRYSHSGHGHHLSE